jgi:hypothetical protein
MGLFVIPAVLTSVAKDRIDDVTRVALFSLTPLFAVIFEPYLGVEAGETVEGKGNFLGVMVAIGGTFLVFPVEMPRSYGEAFVMLGVVGTAASIAAANCAAVRLVQQSVSRLTFASLASGSAALVLGLLGWALHERRVSSVAFDGWTAADLVALALLFWLMKHMNAAKMTTRFVIAPLMANLMSLALIRPHVGVQSWIGLILIAVGSGRLLIPPAENGNSHLTGWA